MSNKIQKSEPIVIGIAGGSGSGKSTFCTMICEKLPAHSVKVISTDSFFIQPLPKALSPVSGKLYDDWNSPSSIDKSRLVESVKQAVAQSKFSDMVLVEGLSALYFEELRKLYSLQVFIDLDSDERMYRRIQRNIKMWDTTVEEVATYYLEMAKYREREYFLNTKDFADIVINGNHIDGVGLDLIIAWVRSQS